MKNVVNRALAAKKKIFALAFLAVFSSFYTMVWGTTWKTGGVKIVSNGDSLTISAIDPEGEGTRGVMPDFDDFDGSGSNKRPSAWSYGIYKIVVNEGVTTIGRYAFQKITNISTVKLPESLTTIKANAFKGCTGVSSIYYKGTPAEWASIDFQGSSATAHPFGGTKSTGDYYFYGGTTKADPIAIEPTITQIKNFAFYRCNISNGLNIPGTITQIGDSALYGTIGGTVVIRAKQAPTLIGNKAFVFNQATIYVPVDATGYTSGLWSLKTKSSQDTIGTTLGTKGENVTWHMSYDGILTLDATNGAKSITIDAANATDMPWYYFRRLVYKVKIRGEATALNNLLHYHFGTSEVIIDQVTIPTISSTYIGGTSYASLFNKRDKLTLTITDPASRLDASWSNLGSAPWNDDTHWRIVYPTTTVTLSKGTETNGTFTLSSSSVTTTDDAQTVTVTCTPANGYVTSSVSALDPSVLPNSITYGGSGNSHTVTFPQYTDGSSTISVEFECATPTFSANLSTDEVEYEKDAVATALSVTASANSGSLSYQWQSSSDNSSWSDIDGADEASFTPPTTETGTTFYHCIVTNTTGDCDESETSNAAQITVTAPSPSAWSLHYGTDGQSDWTTVDFSRVESTTEWQIEDFVIPNKPNWYVDNAAGNDAKKTLSDWGNLYFAASQGDGDRPMVGDATGAIGTVRIYDNSIWNNRYAGFIPNGYVLKIGSTELPFTFESGNEYRTEIFEYNSTNARENVSVGIEDADGHFISTDNTSEMQHLFLKVSSDWASNGAKFSIYDIDASAFKYGFMTLVPGTTDLYEGWVDGTCGNVIFVRHNSTATSPSFDSGNKWNQTGDLALQSGKNYFTINQGTWDGQTEGWSAYTRRGRYCIWQNSIEKNWGVCFRPCHEFNATENANWSNANNWSPNSLPTIDFDVFLNKPVTVNVTTAEAKSIVINQKGDNTGQLVVDAGQKLIMAGTIKKTTDCETYSATEANDIIIHSDATNGLGALVIGSHDGTNQATVNFTTLSSGTSDDNTSVAQYVGTPFNDETNILHNWYNSWVYGIDHTGGIIGWERVNEGQGMAPFKGYCVFSADGTHHNYWQHGTLVASENQTISGLNWQSGVGTANANNENLLANSWMAPIKISAMETSDFTNTEATIYIFNSTSASAYTSLASNYSSYTPGTAGGAIIPAMQSFSVFTNAAGGSSVALDYNKIVYQPAISGTVPGPNRAPLREAAEEANKLRLFVRTESGYGDLLYMWERSDFSEAFENGWDGHKLFGESVAPQLYAVTPDGNMAVNCIPTFEGVQMGFKAGEKDNSYTLTFEYSDEAQPLYLLDIQTNIYTQITSATSYSFTTTDTEVHNRFVLTYNAPSTPTALETTPAVTTGKKVIYDNHLFILHNGRIFSAQGAMIQ